MHERRHHEAGVEHEAVEAIEARAQRGGGAVHVGQIGEVDQLHLDAAAQAKRVELVFDRSQIDVELEFRVSYEL